MATPWRIIFMGTPQIAAATLAQLLAGPDTVVGVVTEPDSSAGRGQKSSASPVRKLAEWANAIPVLAAEKIRTPEFLQSLRAWQPDILVVVAYGRILSKAVLELAPQGCVDVSLTATCRNTAVPRLPPGRLSTAKRKPASAP